VAAVGIRPWQYALGAFFLIFLALEVYSPALDGPFVFDDTYLPFMAPGFRQWFGVRPLLMLSFWINFQWTGLEPYSYHVLNVLFHSINSVLVFFIVRRLLEWEHVDRRLRDTIAGFSAGLFLLHPVQTESVAYVASRSETLSLIFFFGGYLVFLYRKERKVT